MKTRLLVIGLIISIGLNIGLVTGIIVDKYTETDDSRIEYIIKTNDVYSGLDLSDEQLDEISKIRFKWFAEGDTLLDNIIVLKERLMEIEDDSALTESLEGLLDETEEIHKMKFIQYIEQYEDILDEEQMEEFLKKNGGIFKVIELNDDSFNGEMHIKSIIKKDSVSGDINIEKQIFIEKKEDK